MNKPSVDSVASMKKQRVPLFNQDQMVWAGGGAAVVQGLGLACSQALGKPALMLSCPPFLPSLAGERATLPSKPSVTAQCAKH